MAKFQKGDPKPKGSGRKPGQVSKFTATVKEAVEIAAEGIGGVTRLMQWIKEDKANEYAFWTSMYMRLLPLHLHATGNTMFLNLPPDQIDKKLEESGLPPMIFDADVPMLELKANKPSKGNGSDR